MGKRADDRLIKQALAIEAEAAKDVGMVGYIARILLQATMPHSAKPNNEFSRTNGNLRVSITAPSAVGLPYGSYPRLLLIWLTSEAVRTKNRRLCLGDSLSGLTKALGLQATGGHWGTIPRLYDQANRLFQSHVVVCESMETLSNSQSRGSNVVVADAWDLWWNSAQSDRQRSLFRSWVNLSDSFFHMVTDRPVPIDLRVIRSLKKSPLALDVYSWATYRMSYLRRRTEIPWASLQMQFGADYASTPEGCRNFRKRLDDALRKITTLYPDLRAQEGTRGLILLPSPPHVRRLR